jgi:methionyl-tRNA formyltransferase
VVFFGTPQFAVPTLDALLGSRHAVVGVVTQPDRPRGRGQKQTEGPVKARSRAAGLPVIQPDTLKDPRARQTLVEFNADIGVVAAFGKILSEAVLAIPPRGMINVHASLLPKYRGAAPVHRAIMAGEAVTGVTIMRVVKALDAGPMMATARRPIGPDETSDVVEADLANIGAALLVRVVDQIADGHATETPQDDAAATYAHRLTKDDGVVNWTQSASAIHDRIRGLHPWPHAFSFLDGRRLILLRSAIESQTSVDPPGTVVEAAGDRLTIATGDRLLRLLQIQPEGKRALSARDFLAGHPLPNDARFGPDPRR